jgi:ATP-dependent Lon protease
MEMTREIAVAIHEWAMAYVYRVSAGLAHPDGRRLPAVGTKVRDYILSRCRDHELFLTSDGAAVFDQLAKRLDVEATAVINRPQPEVASDQFDEVAETLEGKKREPDPAVTPVPPLPSDGVPWSLCDGKLARDRAGEKDSKSLAERVTVLNQLAERPLRWLPAVTPDNLAGVRGLVRSYPNFEPAIGVIVRHLCLLRLGRAALRLPPLLLAGPPGVGKTRFALALAGALSMHLRIQSMAEATANWILTGNSRSWHNGSPGVIARTVAECPTGKVPLVLLDELDKASGEYRYPADTALLGLLERETARQFRDENLDLPLDLSPVSFLLTANRIDRIRPEVLSRVTLVDIPAPNTEQMPAIVRSVDAAIREEYPQLDQAFDPLDDAVVVACGTHPPRDLRRLLLEAYARAAEREAGRTQGVELRAQDLEAAAQNVTRRASAKILVGMHGPWRMH